MGLIDVGNEEFGHLFDTVEGLEEGGGCGGCEGIGGCSGVEFVIMVDIVIR